MENILKEVEQSNGNLKVLVCFMILKRNAF